MTPDECLAEAIKWLEMTKAETEPIRSQLLELANAWMALAAAKAAE